MNRVKSLLAVLKAVLTVQINRFRTPFRRFDKPRSGSVSFVTLANNGYRDYTSNLLKSIELSSLTARPKVYCLDRQCYKKFKAEGRDVELLWNWTRSSGSPSFRTGNWHSIVFNKFLMIHRELRQNEYVLAVDGDIVFRSGQVIEYLLNTMGDNDLYIQNNGMDDSKGDELCSGFMFIRASDRTLELFNPRNVMSHVRKGWGDQIYINQIKNDLKFKLLPLKLFPNGQYFYAHYPSIEPHIVHFNWIKGDEKKVRMAKHGMWLI